MGSISVSVTGSAVICPGALNETTVTKTATYTASVPIPGSSCGGTSGGVASPYSSGSGIYGSGSSGQSQGSGGGSPGGTGAISTLSGDEGCIYPGNPNSPPGPPEGPPDGPPDGPPSTPPGPQKALRMDRRMAAEYAAGYASMHRQSARYPERHLYFYREGP